MNSNVFRVVVRLGGAPLAQHDWLAFDAAGQYARHGTGMPPVAQTYDLAIPAAWLTAHRLHLPKVSEKQRSQLIAQALEDRVLGALSDYQWFAGVNLDGVSTVWVIEHARLAQLTSWTQQQTQAFERWVPEFALLPADQTCVDAAEGLMLLLNAEPVWLADESELLALPTSQPVQRIATDALIAPAAQSVNFYRVKHTGVSLQTLWKDWRLAIYLLASCVVVMILSLLVQWRSLASREVVLRQEIRQTFASLFPGVPIVDPMLQWQSQQGKTSQSGGDALDAVYRSAAQLDGELGVISMGAKDGKIQLILPAEKASPLMSKLTAQGLRVQGNALPEGRFSIEVQP